MTATAANTAGQYKVTWHDAETNAYHTETFTSGKDWANKVLIVNNTDGLRLVATEVPEDDNL